MKTTEFLNFNGKNLLFLSNDGTYWVAIKPICEALNVNYNRQYQNIKEDEILSQLFAKQQTVGADNKLRNMICLPEKYVYGWLFSIKSASEELKEYKLECYNILYNHFHGAITGRKKLLFKRMDVRLRMWKLKEELKGNKAYQELTQLEKENKEVAKDLKNNDVELLEQPTLFG